MSPPATAISNGSTTSRRSPEPTPPSTIASGAKGAFAFHPPCRSPDRRYQTASSVSTVAQVVTPPDELPLSELATFNGHRPTQELPSGSILRTAPSTPNFAFQPPTFASVNPSGSQIRYHSPSNAARIIPENNPLLRRVGSTTEPEEIRETVQSMLPTLDVYVHGHVPTRSDSDSKSAQNTMIDNLSAKDEYDSCRALDLPKNIEREIKSGLDAKSILTSTSNPSSPPDLYLHDVEDSPYAEVRASVSNIDDVDMPCLTFRTWVIGLLLCVSVSAVNLFFDLRSSSPYISSTIIILLSHPCGLALARLLPIHSWRLPRGLPFVGGWEFSLNHSSWSIKEHAMILIMAYPATNPDYGFNLINVVEKWYHLHVSLGFTLLLLLSTQLAGIGLAGLSHRVLVRPASMIWPNCLVHCALLHTLHGDEIPTNGISRFRFFCYAAGAAFFYYFLPGFLFTGLSLFSFVCWIRPKNLVVNQLFGTVSGLGMGFLTFDWSQISYNGSPLTYPFWAQLNTMAGFVLFYWIIGPYLYYSNVWKTGHLPISGLSAYDRFAEPYNISRILDSDHRFNVTAYEEYSPLYLPVTFAMTYLLAFMLSTALLVHTVLYFGPEVLRRLKDKDDKDDDIHAKLMRSYPEVPSWCYSFLTIACTVMMTIAVKIGNFGMPVWGPLLAMVVATIYYLPVTYLLAIAGELGLSSVVAQAIAGSDFPGSAISNMIFKTIFIQSIIISINTSMSLKIAHYIKCGHRPVFAAQIVSALVGLFTQALVKEVLFHYVQDICSPRQQGFLSCPSSSVMYTASVVWGLIGPTRQFGNNSLYSFMPYATIIGAILPVLLWLWLRRHPGSKLKYVHTPVIIAGPLAIPPAGGINFSSWFVVGFIFQYWIRTRYFRWWSKYNYVLSAALDSGTMLGIFAIFFALQLPNSGSISLDWWGNTVWKNTADFAGAPFYSTDPIKGF